MLIRLETERGPCRATESIQEVIRALNYTMRDVEEAWNVWRSDYVRATLRNGTPLPLPSHMTMLLRTSSGFANPCRLLATSPRPASGRFRGIRVLVPSVPLRWDFQHHQPTLGCASRRGAGNTSGRCVRTESREYRRLSRLCTSERCSTSPNRSSAHPRPDPRSARFPCTATERCCWCIGLPAALLSPTSQLSVAAAATAADEYA